MFFDVFCYLRLLSCRNWPLFRRNKWPNKRSIEIDQRLRKGFELESSRLESCGEHVKKSKPNDLAVTLSIYFWMRFWFNGNKIFILVSSAPGHWQPTSTGLTIFWSSLSISARRGNIWTNQISLLLLLSLLNMFVWRLREPDTVMATELTVHKRPFSPESDIVVAVEPRGNKAGLNLTQVI